jgi:TonB family protein
MLARSIVATAFAGLLLLGNACGQEPASAAASAPGQVPRATLDNAHCDAYRDTSSSMRPPKDVGTVVLRIQVSPQGEAVGSEIVERTTTNYFARIAQENFTKCHFNPARENGVPVAGVALLRLKFGERLSAPNNALCPPMAIRETAPSDGPMAATQLRIHFTPAGGVAAVDVLKSSGSPTFDEAAVKAYRQCHFDPGASGQPAFQEEWVTTLSWSS